VSGSESMHVYVYIIIYICIAFVDPNTKRGEL
jgi:hypothetical protein